MGYGRSQYSVIIEIEVLKIHTAIHILYIGRTILILDIRLAS